MLFQKTAFLFFAWSAVFLFFFAPISGTFSFVDAAESSSGPVNLNVSGTGLEDTGKAAGFKEGQNQLPGYIGTVLKAFFGVLGIIFLALTIYGGLRWMLSQGNDTEIKGARDTIISAVIGIAIVAASYAITDFVIDQLVKSGVKQEIIGE